MTWWSGRVLTIEAIERAELEQARDWTVSETQVLGHSLTWWLTAAAASSVAAATMALQELTMRELGPEVLGPYLTVLVVLSHMAVGSAVGLMIAAALAIVRRLGFSSWMDRRREQTKLALGFILGFMPFLAVVAIVVVRGLEVRALSTQLALLPGILMFTGLVVALIMLRLKPSVVTQLSVVLTPALVLGLMIPMAPANVAGASAVLEKGLFSRMAVLSARGLYDSDADGYASHLCEHACDCNDESALIHPGAAEVTDNGVDEDCDGEDLTAIDMQRYGLSMGLTQEEEPEADDADEAGPPEWQKRHNVLLIVMDTVRADHLGCHGYARDTSPRLDAFASKAVHFTQARSQGSMTRESMPALLTGKYFAEVSRVEQKWPHILPDNEMMAEMFKEAGYQTWAMSSFGYFVPYFGYGQGFDEYDDKISKEGRVHWLRTSHRVTDGTLEAIDRLEEDPDRPWLAMAHYADPHSGYMFHKESPKFGPYVYDLYDQEIFYTDLHLGRLFDGLEERGLMDDTIIVITADHGEGLKKKEDHGHLYHGQTLYDELIHVPMMIHTPFAQPRRVDRPVAVLDVLPTLLELTGVTTDVRMRGFSLNPYLQGDESFVRPPVFSQKAQPKWKELVSVVDWPWKAIWKVRTNHFELYRLDQDPREAADLASTKPEQMREMSNQLRLWRSSLEPPNEFRYGR